MSKFTGPLNVSPIGEPTAVRDPSALIVNVEMLLSCLFAVYKCEPAGSIANPNGLFPVKVTVGVPSTP